MYRPGRLLPDLVQRCPAVVAEQRVVSGGQDRGPPPVLAGELGSSDGIDATKDPMETALLDAMLDRVAGVAEVDELVVCDHAELLAGG
jgi:hypothetical protein